MKRHTRMVFAAILVAAVFFGQADFTSAAPGATETAVVKPADHSSVCMVTNMVPGDRKMFPVEVDGKTYYGCCPVCVKRLKTERAVRYAVDPVTGREVDKSAAFIVAGPDRKAFYFASSESAAKFRSLPAAKRIMQ